MTLRTPLRELPVLDLARPTVAPAGPRDPFAPDDARLAEFRPEAPALPRFFVWTLGCQMNKSDSEEMAGRLLAAGCAEAGSMATAEKVCGPSARAGVVMSAKLTFPVAAS